MKLSCNVIKDILPLYYDKICSEESKAIVEEHLKDCDECRNVLEKIHEEMHLSENNSEESKPLKKLSYEWNKSKTKSLFKGVIITALSAIVLIGGYFALTQWKCVPISSEQMTISDICTTDDGAIGFHFIADDGKEVREIKIDYDCETGVAYITPKRSVIEQRKSGDVYMSLNDHYYFVEVLFFTEEQLSSPEYESYIASSGNSAYADFSFPADINKICIGSQKDHIVLWEEGTTLPPASKEIENIYQSGGR